MVEVAVLGHQVYLKLSWWAGLLALRHGFSFGLDDLEAVYAEPRPDYAYPWWQGKRSGSSIPGVVRARTFRWGDYREFWCDDFRGNAAVFELRGEPYNQLVVAVRDPEAVVRAVRAARQEHQ